MVKTLRTTILAIASLLEKHSGFDYVEISEPARAPEGYTAVIQNIGMHSEETDLAGTIELRTISIRIYHRAPLNAPEPEIELRLGDFVDEVIEALLGNFSLGGTIRNIEPIRMTVDWGYQTIQNEAFRVAELKLPMTVDDSATFVK